MEHEFTYRGVAFTVTLNAAPGRQTRWTYRLPSGAIGTGTALNREAALRRGEEAGRFAIAEEQGQG